MLTPSPFSEGIMNLRALLPTIMATLFLSASAQAQDNGFFAGLDVSGGLASGSSDTTNGGADFAGGGVVDNVKFGETLGIGGHIGYRFTPSFSAFIGYQYVQGSVNWDANFPLFNITSDFKGDAISNVLMGNLAYDWALSEVTSIRASAGLGMSIDSLSDVVETDRGTGLFLADVADHTRTSPAAQLGAGIQHKITSNMVLGLNAAVSYTDSFETGNTRSGNLGVTSITPYRIDDVWRANLGVSIRFKL